MSASNSSAQERILHLVDLAHCAGPGLRMIAGLVAAAPAPERHAMLLIGGSVGEREAHRSGLRTLDRISPPFGRAELAMSGLRRFIDVRGEPSVVCCWGGASASLAGVFERAAIHVCSLSPLEPLSRRLSQGRLMRTIERSRNLVFFESAAQEASDRRLLGAARNVRLAAAPLPKSAPTAEARQAIRSRLKADDEALVVQLIGSPADSLDGNGFALVLAACAVLGQRTIGVCHPSARQLERGLRLLEKQTWPARMVVTDEPSTELLAGADVAIWRPSGDRFASVIPVLESAALGIPVVASRTRALDGVWELGMGALVDHPEPLHMAIPIQRVVSERTGVMASQEGQPQLVSIIEATGAY